MSPAFSSGASRDREIKPDRPEDRQGQGQCGDQDDGPGPLVAVAGPGQGQAVRSAVGQQEDEVVGQDEGDRGQGCQPEPIAPVTPDHRPTVRDLQSGCPRAPQHRPPRSQAGRTNQKRVVPSPDSAPTRPPAGLDQLLDDRQPDPGPAVDPVA